MHAVRRQTRQGLAVAGLFAVAAVVAAIVGRGDAPWLPVHLFVVGTLLSAIVAVTTMLAVTWSTAPAPHPVIAAVPRALIAVGTIALAIGRERGHEWLVWFGGGAIAAALVVQIPILAAIHRRGKTPRYRPAIEGYITALACGLVGATLGTLVATGRGGSSWGQWRATHLTLNLFGLVGLVIAATVPYFVATQARMKMSPLAGPLRLRVTTGALFAATVVAAVGRYADRPRVTALGLAAYAAGLIVLAILLPRPGRRQWRWAGARLVQLATGGAWWIVATVLLAVVVLRGGEERPVLVAMIVGGFGQILIASLAYLGPVVRAGRPEELTAGFARTRSWLSLAALNLAAAASLARWWPVVALAIAVVGLDGVIRAVALLATTRPRA